MEIDMMRKRPGAIGFTSGFSQDHKYSTVGEQITVEKLTELSIVMRISRYDHVYRHHTTRKTAIDEMDTNGAPRVWCAIRI